MSPNTDTLQDRNYRNLVNSESLVSFGVTVQETDLFVHAAGPMIAFTRERVFEHRGIIEAYIEQYPEFMTTLVPWRDTRPVPDIIRTMIEVGKKAGVGPMAAVAGAVAEFVGRDLLNHSPEIIVENGGDIFLKVDHPVIVGLYGGNSPLSLKLGLRVPNIGIPLGVCTSSGTVGHSLSMGRADAVCVVSESCALADAAATSIGNRITMEKDIKDAIEVGKRIDGVLGLVIMIGKDMGFWGDLEVVPLKIKKA